MTPSLAFFSSLWGLDGVKRESSIFPVQTPADPKGGAEGLRGGGRREMGRDTVPCPDQSPMTMALLPNRIPTDQRSAGTKRSPEVPKPQRPQGRRGEW